MLEEANREVAKNPNSQIGYMMRGKYYLDALEDELAIKEFDRAIKIDPKYAPAFLHRGLAYEHLEKYDEAFKDYAKSAQLSAPQTAWIPYKASAILHSNLGHYAAAIDDFSKVLDNTTQDPVSYFRRAECYLLSKQYDSAGKDASRFLLLTGGDHRGYWVRAQAYAGAKNPKAALKDISDLIHVTEGENPDSCFENLTRYYQFRARIHEQLGKKDLALKDSERAQLAAKHALKIAPFKNRSKP